MTGYFFIIFFGTFILENISIILGVFLFEQDEINIYAAFLACLFGIFVGDIAIYIIGFLIAKLKLVSKFKKISNILNKSKHKIENNIILYPVFIARFVPSTRSATYLSFGFNRYPFIKFIFINLMSVIIWLTPAFFGLVYIYPYFINNLVICLLIFMVFLVFLKSVFQKILNYWEIKALKNSWRRWLHFEFWPSWIFYTPVVFYYVFLSLRYKNFFLPFYANPSTLNGALFANSKWDFLKYLSSENSFTLPTVYFRKGTPFVFIMKSLKENNISFPFIIKPDLGPRGFGVRTIRNEAELNLYLDIADFSFIIQKPSLYFQEARIFYYKYPNSNDNGIFLITDKNAPFVVADGMTKLGDLILKDKRARLISSYYFRRLQKRLQEIHPKNKKIILTGSGKYAQSTLFIKEKDLTECELKKVLEKIAQSVPNLFFGRFDIRFQNQEMLMQGKNFEIMEIQGAIVEATPLWSTNEKLFDTYRVLFQQWEMAFKIGYAVKQNPQFNTNIDVKLFLKECLKVFFRKDF